MSTIISKLKADIKQITNDTSSQQYECWIPNNSGILRWERIGVPGDSKGRITFNENSFSSERSNIKQIEVIDTNVEIDDYLPTFPTKLKDVVKSFYKSDGTLKEKIKFMVNKYQTVGFFTKLFPVFLTDVSFLEIDKNGTQIAVTSGNGHLVEKGIYKGEALLLFLPRRDLKKLIDLKTETKLYQIYTKNNYSNSNASTKFNTYREEVINLLKSKLVYCLSLNYSVEAKGKIILDPLNIYYNQKSKLDVTLDNFTYEDGYKNYIQLMYGRIKKIFHGDNHHHNKDDVILRVFNVGTKPNIVLEQFAAHIKHLEKVEQNRKLIKCERFIPSFTNDSKGIIAYAKMYYCNYLTHNEVAPKIALENKRLLNALESTNKSLESTVERYKETQERGGRKIPTIFREFPFWLFLLALFTFSLSEIKKSVLLENVWLFDYFGTFIIDIVRNFNLVFNIVTMLFLYYVYRKIFEGKIEKSACLKKYLHSDFRPKDEYYSKAFDKKSFSSTIVSFAPYIVGFPIIGTFLYLVW